MDGLIGTLAEQGYAVLRDQLPKAIGQDCAKRLAAIVADAPTSRRIEKDHPVVGRVLGFDPLRLVLRQVLGVAARPVRVLYFDKTGERNWAVPWHQDRTIAVARADRAAEVSHWTVKDGIPHCEAPVELLERMLTVRWHIDASDPEDGGLLTLPGSHRPGRMTRPDIKDRLAAHPRHSISLPAGGFFLMRPLLVHASRRRTTGGRRRVLHIELAVSDPPPPLRWA